MLGCELEEDVFASQDDDDVIADDDDSVGDDDDVVGTGCPNPSEQIRIDAGTYELLGHGVDNPEIIPQVRPGGEYDFDGMTCIEACRFPGCGSEQIGQHETIGDGLTYAMVEFIAEHAPEKFGRRLCTAAEHLVASALPENLAYGYGDVYDPNACDSSLSPIHPLGELDTCVSALGVRDVVQRGDWVIVDVQTAGQYNAWSDDHDWTCLGPESENNPALIEEGWLVVSGGTNDRCDSAFYGCYVNSLHWHVHTGDPFSYGNPDVEYDDDTLRFCVDIDGPPTDEQEALYQEARTLAQEQVSYGPLLEELGWLSQPASAKLPTTGMH